MLNKCVYIENLPTVILCNINGTITNIINNLLSYWGPSIKRPTVTFTWNTSSVTVGYITGNKIPMYQNIKISVVSFLILFMSSTKIKEKKWDHLRPVYWYHSGYHSKQGCCNHLPLPLNYKYIVSSPITHRDQIGRLMTALLWNVILHILSIYSTCFQLVLLFLLS